MEEEKIKEAGTYESEYGFKLAEEAVALYNESIFTPLMRKYNRKNRHTNKQTSLELVLVKSTETTSWVYIVASEQSIIGSACFSHILVGTGTSTLWAGVSNMIAIIMREGLNKVMKKAKPLPEELI
jgi:hypothetical protein